MNEYAEMILVASPFLLVVGVVGFLAKWLSNQEAPRCQTKAHPRIVFDSKILSGKAHINGSQVTIAMLIGQLAAGESTEQLLHDYPCLEAEDILQALAYAAACVSKVDGYEAANPAFGMWGDRKDIEVDSLVRALRAPPRKD